MVIQPSKRSESQMTALIGLEIDPPRSAFCVAEPEWRDDGTCHFVIRHLDSLPLRTPFQKVGHRWAEILGKLEGKVERPMTFVNVTSAGMPVFNLIRESAGGWLEPVQFVPGHQEPEKMDDILRFGKAFAVRRLQVLLETNRLHLPETPDSRSLADELARADVPESEGSEPGVFRVGTRDELVTALGLAVSRDTQRPSEGSPYPPYLGPGNPVDEIYNLLHNAKY